MFGIPFPSAKGRASLNMPARSHIVSHGSAEDGGEKTGEGRKLLNSMELEAIRKSLNFVTGGPGRASCFRVADSYGQSLPDPLWWCGGSVKTTHDHSAQ